MKPPDRLAKHQRASRPSGEQKCPPPGEYGSSNLRAPDSPALPSAQTIGAAASPRADDSAPTPPQPAIGPRGSLRRAGRISLIVLTGCAALVTAVLLTANGRQNTLASDAARRSTQQAARHEETMARVAEAVRRATKETRNPLATIIYVDDDANADGDGTTWATAFNDLQDGLDAAALLLGGAPAEVWVAEGTYTPDRGTGDRTRSFLLPGRVAMYGGFLGSEDEIAQRDWVSNPTILSGDLAGDDVGTTGMDDNSKHVLYRGPEPEEAVLDGFIITSGNDDSGSGRGGGLFCLTYPVVIRNCVFRGNRATSEGGGAYVASDSVFIDVVFIDNEASRGGAVSLGDRRSSPVLINAQFSGNTAYRGGAVFSDDGDPVFINTLFNDNTAQYGGACFITRGNGGRGGPIPISFAAWVNCTLSRNAARFGGAVNAEGSGGITFSNSILWGNTDTNGSGEISQLDLGQSPWPTLVAIDHTCLQEWSGTFGGIGNTGVDPGFVDLLVGDYRLTPPSSAIDAGNNEALPAEIVFDLAGRPRFVDHPSVPDTGISPNGAPIVDMGAFEWVDPDCNSNGVPDTADLVAGSSQDCNNNEFPDECETASDCNSNGIVDICEVATDPTVDCNRNWIPDDCDVMAGASTDCDSNGSPDECDFAWDNNLDCDGNGLFDACELAAGSAADCNANGHPDNCDVDGVFGPTYDCNGNAIPDECDIAAATSTDLNGNAKPDECEPDCNGNGWPDDYDIWQGVDTDCNGNVVPDLCDVASGASDDCNSNAIPDECEVDCNGNGVPDDCDLISGGLPDCNANAIPDSCDIGSGTEADCNANLVPDVCDVQTGVSHDCNENSVPDECDGDCDGNGLYDGCDLAAGTATDCNSNGIPDECDMQATPSIDCDGNSSIDDCELLEQPDLDCDGSGTLDVCDIANDPTLDCNRNAAVDSCDIASGTSTDCDMNGVPDSCDLSAGIEILFDTFAETSFDPLHWSLVFRANTSPQYFVSPPYSLQLVNNSFIRSVSVDTRGQTAIRLEYWWRGVNTEGGDDLLVSYWAEGSWKTLAVHNGAADPPNWQFATWDLRDLPPGEGFRFQLVSPSSSTGHSWYIDDVRVLIPGAQDCNSNGILDSCDLGAGTSADCNRNAVPDICDVIGRASLDCNSNGVPDECEADCDSNGVADACELVGDVDHDGVVDAADLDGYLACMTGPCASPPCAPTLYADECCVVADGDADGDVDLSDFRNWQYVFDRVCDVDADCDDGLFCSGAETCVEGLCQRGSYPCTDPVNSFCLEDVDGCTYPPLPGMAEDFEGYACGEQSPDFWVDTEADGSLVVNDGLFDVGCLGNVQALHTASTATNIHSHYTELGSADWSTISYTGRMMYTAFTGGVGVTFMSQYPGDARYYRLRRHQWTPTFHISPSAGVEIPIGTLDSGVLPTPNVWYRYAIEVTETGAQTEIRAKVWRDGDPKPTTWQVDCHDASPTRLTQGTVGVWSMGDGEKYWDDLAVVAGQP